MTDRRTVNRFIAALATCASLSFLVPALAQPAVSAPPALKGAALVAALRGGGYILYFRHTATDFSQNDFSMSSYEDCATQRNLNDQGRADARAIGVALRALAIPIGEVLASPFCRTIETAQLIFGRAIPSSAVRGGPEHEGPPALYAEMREVLVKPVPPGTNLAIVSHGNPFHALAGGAYLEEGEAAVVLPRGKDGFRVVARVPQEAWRALEPALAQPAVAAPPELKGAALVAALRGGGYVLYFRHTATDFGQNDERMTGYEDCATQRNLIDKGRADARAIGAALRTLAIPVGEVLASPFCRTMETAKLIFGHATASPAVRGGPAQPESPERYAALRNLLAAPVPNATNRAIVSHGNPFRAVGGGTYLAEGEAAVIEPRGTDGFRIVARVPVEAWRALEATPK
jgi:broad specificity phosphatase PhoE